MKKSIDMYRYLLATALVTICSFSFAQIVEKEMNMSAGEKSGLEVDLPVDSKTAEKLWKEYIKPYGKADWDRRNKEHVLFDVRIASITSQSLTIVAKFNQYKDVTKGSFWFKSGEDFISAETQPDAIQNAGEFLQEYAYDTNRSAIRGEIKIQDKQLKSFDKDLSKLQKKNQSLHKDIEKAKAEIAKKEREIEENLKAQETKKKAIEDQKMKIQQTTIKLTNVGKAANSGN